MLLEQIPKSETSSGTGQVMEALRILSRIIGEIYVALSILLADFEEAAD